MKNIVKLSVLCAATLSACWSLSHAQEVHKTGEVKVTAGRVEQQLLDNSDERLRAYRGRDS